MLGQIAALVFCGRKAWDEIGGSRRSLHNWEGQMQLCFSLSPQQAPTQLSQKLEALSSRQAPAQITLSYIPLHKKAPATSQGDTSNPRRVGAGLPKPHTPHAFRKPTNTKEIKPSGVQALVSALLLLHPAFSKDLLLELTGLAPSFIFFL